MTARRLIAIILTQSALAVAAFANPIPLVPVDRPLLEEVIERVVWSTGTSDGRELHEHLYRHGFSFSPRVVVLLRAHMTRLEPFFLAYQSQARRIDRQLHEAFLNWASPSAVASMCDILRERLDALREPVPGADEVGRLTELVVCGEILADYGDTSAVDAIEAARDSVRTALPDLVPRFHPTRHPAWFLTMALGRIDDPGSGAILRRAPDGGSFTLFRQASDIAVLQVMAEGCDWHQVSPNAKRDALLLSHLAKSKSSRSPAELERPQPEWGRASLVIEFSDGSVARIDVTNRWIRYHEESRYAAPEYWLLSEPLVGDIWDLLEPLEDLIEL